jgi:hypothetical protein
MGQRGALNAGVRPQQKGRCCFENEFYLALNRRNTMSDENKVSLEHIDPRNLNRLNAGVSILGVKILVNDIAEKVGSLFGEKGRKIGKDIDDNTKDIDIHIGL